MSTDGGILLPSSDAEDRTLTVAKDTVQKTFKCNLPVPPALTHGKKTTQCKNQTYEWRKLTPYKEAQTCNPLTPSMTCGGEMVTGQTSVTGQGSFQKSLETKAM